MGSIIVEASSFVKKNLRNVEKLFMQTIAGKCRQILLAEIGSRGKGESGHNANTARKWTQSEEFSVRQRHGIC